MNKLIKNKIINYVGTKIKYTEIVNDMLSQSNNKNYFEPFLGSGAIFLNLNKEYDRYVIGDLNQKIIRIFLSFKNSNYSDYKDFINFVNSKFGSLTCKINYYNFREYFNQNLHNKNNILEGFGIYLLCNSGFGSFLRYGKNGFSNTSGLRAQEALVERRFNIIKSKLQRSEIYHRSFDQYENVNGFDMFLDPPYFDTYIKYGFEEENFKEKYSSFIKNKSKTNLIIGTDTRSNSKSFSFKYELQLLRKFRSISPNQKENNFDDEIIFKVLNTTKVCKCGSDKLIKIRSQNKKICNNCCSEIKWDLEKGQKYLR